MENFHDVKEKNYCFLLFARCSFEFSSSVDRSQSTSFPVSLLHRGGYVEFSLPVGKIDSGVHIMGIIEPTHNRREGKRGREEIRILR